MYLFNYSISKTHTIFIIVRKYSDRKSKANIENQFSRGSFRRKCLLEAKHPVRKWVAEEEFAWLELLSGYDRFTTPYIRIFPGRDMATIGTGIGGEGERGWWGRDKGQVSIDVTHTQCAPDTHTHIRTIDNLHLQFSLHPLSRFWLSFFATRCALHFSHFSFPFPFAGSKREKNNPPTTFPDFLRFVRLSWPTASSVHHPSPLSTAYLQINLVPHSPGEQFVAQSFVAPPKAPLFQAKMCHFRPCQYIPTIAFPWRLYSRIARSSSLFKLI